MTELLFHDILIHGFAALYPVYPELRREFRRASPPFEVPTIFSPSRHSPARRSDNGKRCRLPGSEPQLGLCPRHFRQRLAAGLAACDDFSDLSKDLLRGPLEFSSAEDLCEYLTRLLILMTKGRISPRRAAVLAYITNQLLHSHVAAEKELADEESQILFDLPRPKRDDDISPERAMINRWADRCASASPGSAPGATEDHPGTKEST